MDETKETFKLFLLNHLEEEEEEEYVEVVFFYKICVGKKLDTNANIIKKYLLSL